MRWSNLFIYLFHSISLADYTVVVGRKKSERWVKKSSQRRSYYDDDYEW